MRLQASEERIGAGNWGVSVLVQYVHTERIDDEQADGAPICCLGYGFVYVMVTKAVPDYHQAHIWFREVLLEALMIPFEDWMLVNGCGLVAAHHK
jgi:hypothetical protein